ncbi:antibiotic biosynthesis monooxygenase [Providencia vermicola]|uniref:antibiotic biosynthesis monooxygenase family protein n=1 Tax=Providencia TaxID=586 RepID=UPI0012B62386|nr:MULTISPECIES: antibiotic biosynthesis monooxygenase [Providencia]ELR5122022.1 antibiotic biosynthesis monooxygenase [Providencia stuartii]ELR5123443.1 antibiotic biosynthesis monooxygenase [Providencia stuartii]ELZ5940730.1 antibiotic biosynthesis monooxygenase [Providencia stuartii]ELZ5941604.1 antibiotic biosynthesis monooxygenase [Providencia stuartii]MCK1144663.1 antibiotic biosynthesis monooxygenase [Providencia stuartii]
MIAVIFEVQIQPNQQTRYLALAEELKTLLTNVSGFIAIERFQSLSTEGKMLSLSWWKDEDAVLQWKNHVLHAKAQQEGRESIFSYYKISITHLVREYSFKKDNDNV